MIPIPTRFCWTARDRRLFAKHRDVTIDTVGSLPELHGFPKRLVEIDYWGHRGEYRESAACERQEMSGAQASVIESLLEGMAARARAMFGLEQEP